MGGLLELLYEKPVITLYWEAADCLFKKKKSEVNFPAMAAQGFVTNNIEEKLCFLEVATLGDESQKSCSWELPAAGVTPLD